MEENNLACENKEMLQYDMEKETKKIVKTEIEHFTTTPSTENEYGKWLAVVKEYLAKGYQSEFNQNEFVIDENIYKVLRKDEVTAFYDSMGNTLFDIENKRLETEYKCMMKQQEKSIEDCQMKEQIEESRKEEKVTMTSENLVNGKEQARKKLGEEQKRAKDKEFADLVIKYLLKRCEEDNGLAEDILQEHKTWEKCSSYIYSNAKKQAKGNCVVIRDDVVYEWAEDYYHLDDKALEAKQAKEFAELKKYRDEMAKKNNDKNKFTSAISKAEKTTSNETRKQEEAKPKKNSKDMEGQIDLFSLMGM